MIYRKGDNMGLWILGAIMVAIGFFSILSCVLDDMSVVSFVAGLIILITGLGLVGLGDQKHSIVLIRVNEDMISNTQNTLEDAQKELKALTERFEINALEMYKDIAQPKGQLFNNYPDLNLVELIKEKTEYEKKLRSRLLELQNERDLEYRRAEYRKEYFPMNLFIKNKEIK